MIEINKTFANFNFNINNIKATHNQFTIVNKKFFHNNYKFEK